MRERRFYFVVVLILFFNVENFSQIKSASIKLPINYTLANFEFENVCLLDWNKDSNAIPKKINSNPALYKLNSLLIVATKPILSQSFYSAHLGFFCKKELQLQKITAVPFRFRLGSLDYVNYLEQKPNASKPH